MRPRVAAIGTIVTEQMSEGRREKEWFSVIFTLFLGALNIPMGQTFSSRLFLQGKSGNIRPKSVPT